MLTTSPPPITTASCSCRAVVAVAGGWEQSARVSLTQEGDGVQQPSARLSADVFSSHDDQLPSGRERNAHTSHPPFTKVHFSGQGGGGGNREKGVGGRQQVGAMAAAASSSRMRR